VSRIEWEEQRWFTCNRRLVVENPDAPLEKEPSCWTEAKVAKRCAQEEVVETLIILNLPVLLGEDVTYLFRAGD